MRIPFAIALLGASVPIAAAACWRAEPPPLTVTTPMHREASRVVLEVHCGLCHLPDAGEPEFRGIAIGVFDLSQPDWSSTLSDAQLHELVRKARDDNGVPANDVSILQRFVSDEIAFRDAHTQTYPRLARDTGLLGEMQSRRTSEPRPP